MFSGNGEGGGLWADRIELRMKRHRRRVEENLEEITFLLFPLLRIVFQLPKTKFSGH